MASIAKQMVAAGQIYKGRLMWFAVSEGFDSVTREPNSGSVFVVPNNWPKRRFRGRA